MTRRGIMYSPGMPCPLPISISKKNLYDNFKDLYKTSPPNHMVRACGNNNFLNAIYTPRPANLKNSDYTTHHGLSCLNDVKLITLRRSFMWNLLKKVIYKVVVATTWSIWGKTAVIVLSTDKRN